MNIKVTCELCGNDIYEGSGKDALSMADCANHVCPPTPHECRAQYGTTDVEMLALLLYDIFHGQCSCECHGVSEFPWEPYARNDHDTVVAKFRRVAVDVAAAFAGGPIGKVYYDAD